MKTLPLAADLVAKRGYTRGSWGLWNCSPEDTAEAQRGRAGHRGGKARGVGAGKELACSVRMSRNSKDCFSLGF